MTETPETPDTTDEGNETTPTEPAPTTADSGEKQWPEDGSEDPRHDTENKPEDAAAEDAEGEDDPE